MALDTATCHVGTLFYYVCSLCNSLTEGNYSDVLIYYVVSGSVEAYQVSCAVHTSYRLCLKSEVD